jgi:hypothetical protein
MKARPESRRPGNAMGCGIRPRKRPEGELVSDSYDNFLDLNDDMDDLELSAFKRVFLSSDGQIVLARILEKCKFMEPCKNEQDMALNNFAKDLMATIYWDQKKKGLNIHTIIEFLKEKSRAGR